MAGRPRPARNVTLQSSRSSRVARRTAGRLYIGHGGDPRMSQTSRAASPSSARPPIAASSATRPCVRSCAGLRRRADQPARDAAVEGLTAYRSVLDVPGPIDMATIYVPPEIGMRGHRGARAEGHQGGVVEPGRESPALLARAHGTGPRRHRSLQHRRHRRCRRSTDRNS